MKKGQGEMLGLVVIVILLVFSLLFYLSFKGKGESETMRSSLRVNSVLNAVLMVKGSNGEKVIDVLRACVDINNKDSSECSLAETEMGSIFEKILSDRDKEHYCFEAFGNDVTVFTVQGGVCCSSSGDVIRANPVRLKKGLINYRYEFSLCY